MPVHDGVKASVKLFGQLTSNRSMPERFDAFLELNYCALAKCDPTAKPERRDALEARYMAEVGRWPVENIRQVFPRIAAECALGCLRMDYLGTLSGELGLLRAEMGQFFTPWEICRLMASMTTPDPHEAIKGKGYMTVQEPAVGAGAMVLAVADLFRAAGLDLSKTLFVEAADLSTRAFKMAYIQLAFAGIPAKVMHANSLSMEVFETAFTPAFFDFYHAHGNPYARKPDPIPVVRKRTRRNAA